jgi:hypothetical protein
VPGSQHDHSAACRSPTASQAASRGTYGSTQDGDSYGNVSVGDYGNSTMPQSAAPAGASLCERYECVAEEMCGTHKPKPLNKWRCVAPPEPLHVLNPRCAGNGTGGNDTTSATTTTNSTTTAPPMLPMVPVAECDDKRKCPGNSACADGVCSCLPGFFGARCEEGCPTGMADVCACCESGATNWKGECCHAASNVRPVVDKGGECCAAGRLDACGVCNGDGIAVDAMGHCCSVRPAAGLPRAHVV